MSKQAIGSVLVVGGGIAGIQASLDLADSGYLVYLVEKNSAIGGVMSQLDKTFPTNDCSMCIISPKLVEAGRHLNVELLTLTQVKEITGEAGNFQVKLLQQPRYVDIEKCTACGECQKVCPVEISNRFDEGLQNQKAAFQLYPQAMPSAYTIEKKGVAPCKAACPANPSVQGCIALINHGKYKEAYELFMEEHPFPGVCGRVCHHPCEEICTRSKVDEPVSIRSTHRFLADWAKENNISFKPEVKPKRQEKVAVIGSGPAGLSCAYFLGIEGYPVTVLEKHNVLGGMLRIGIPEHRLPRDIIESEIQVIRDLGVRFETGVDVGNDITIGQLREQGYKAFFMGVGAQECKALGIDCEDLEGVYPGVDFLRDVNLGKDVSIGDRVAVIGGGNVAMDSARTALRKGSATPFIIYRRSEAEMPANAEEIEECREEGIEIMTLTTPVRVIGNNGRVKAIECIKMELGEPDSSGRRRPVPVEGSEFTIDVDTMIPAIGQESDWACITDECECTLSDWGTVNVDSVTLQTNDPDIFAGGDAVTGPSTVVDAIAAGKEAAFSIHRFLKGEDLKKERPEKAKPFLDVDTRNVPSVERENMPCLSPHDRTGGFEEVQTGMDESMIRREAARCLECGVCSECYQCVKVCLAEAVVHDMKPVEHEIQVGAVILAPGFTPFNPEQYDTYSYASHPNVVTSIEFERMLSASGPYRGHLIRPSDKKAPAKIAWLQCVGSRDINTCDNSYCSSVCCMYANKQAVIAKEHSDDPLDTAIFYMDLRTYGKDFDAYNLRAQEEHGVRFIRSRIHSIFPDEDDKLRIVYATESGKTAEERFDMVVLSVGLSPSKDVAGLAEKMMVELNEHGFARTSSLFPVSTNRDGIFVCGTFQEPKDIPHAVMEASAAAAAATGNLSHARWSLTRVKELPSETDVTGQEPRIGVFVCNCGINIGGVADVPVIRDYARKLPHVIHVEDNLFACSQDNQDHIKQIIREKGINRVVVASCSPRTHEPLFQETIRDAGLNKYLFEMANIRDHNTWVHMDNPEKATEKAKDLVRMAVAKAAYSEPVHQVSLKISKAALVIGGGISGMEAAVGIADQGRMVYLVEKSMELGGNAKVLGTTWQGENIGPYLEDLVTRVKHHPNIELFMQTEVTGTTGTMGNFSTTLAPLDRESKETKIDHAVTVLATGGKEKIPEQYLYGEHPHVMTQLDMDRAFTERDEQLSRAKSVVFIQCVGSRVPERPYCSKICCTHSLKSALLLKKKNPKIKVYILYRDIRSYGFKEALYVQAREAGVIFIRYSLKDMPKVESLENDHLSVTVTDHVLGMPVRLKPDFLVLASGIVPNANTKLFELFKVPVNSEGFLIEAHAKLRPVDFSSEGIFLAGLAHYPKPIEESIAQAKAAASRAMTILAKEEIMVGGVVASVEEARCAACLTCVRTCPYGIPKINEDSHAVIDSAECHGCGMCVSECPGKAISLQHFTDEQLVAKTSALFTSGG